MLGAIALLKAPPVGQPAAAAAAAPRPEARYWQRQAAPAALPLLRGV